MRALVPGVFFFILFVGFSLGYRYVVENQVSMSDLVSVIVFGLIASALFVAFNKWTKG